MVDDTTLKTLIEDSPLSDEDKAHWNSILQKLNESQRERLHHSLVAKTNIYAAKAAIERAMQIIRDAEHEAAEEDDQVEQITNQTKTQTVTDKAKAEIMKEIDEGNPMMPKKEDLATPGDLATRQQEADTRLAELRKELAHISQEAHGATPPSYQSQS